MSFNGKILIVDDEPHVRKYLGLVLRQLGSPTLIEASNGQEAIDVFQAESPDLTLLDINMPIMEGLEALRQIRALDPEAVVVILTSLSTREMVDQAAGLGAAFFIRKDAPRDQLLALLRQVVADNFEPDENDAAS
jgi:two-component system chemotaxis response regulator CheY